MSCFSIETVAKFCHQANKVLCESLGDNSQKDWSQSPEWQRQSAVDGVRYKLKNADATPEIMHNAWCEIKYREGWIYGETKDADKKTHPCLVAYWELPAEQRAKDHLFSAIVNGLRYFIDESETK